MDNQIKTSFIPRKTIDAAVNFQNTPIRSYKIGRTIFSLVATVTFLVSLAGAGIMFAWQAKLNADIIKQVEAMRDAKNNFDEKTMKDMARLDTRIKESDSMLKNHVAPSELYGLLQEHTLQTIAFSRFSFEDNQDGSIKITGQGEAASYESIVLQSDAFAKSGFLRNIIFSDWRPDQDDKQVSFSFEATLVPDRILYREALKKYNNKEE